MEIDDRHSTPEKLQCTVNIHESIDQLNKLHLVESPKSRVEQVSHGKSRRNIATKGRVLFPKKHETVAWSNKEILSLIQFLMLFTDGKTWVAHKDMKFWDDAGIFINQQSHTHHCRTGKLIISKYLMLNKIY